MRINTNFTTAPPAGLGDSSVYNANLQKIEAYLNEVLAYIETFMNDLSGDGQGIVSGGELSIGSGLTVDATAVTGAWIGGERIDAIASTINLGDDTTNYIYLNQDGDYEVDTTLAFSTTRIPRGKAITESGSVTTLVEYDNTIFTMNEMILQRIMPLGLYVNNEGASTVINVSYLDPDVSGIQSIEVEGSTDDGGTWSTIATVNL